MSENTHTWYGVPVIDLHRTDLIDVINHLAAEVKALRELHGKVGKYHLADASTHQSGKAPK